MSLIIYCDGLCEPMNPGGVATYGWVAYEGETEIANGYNFIAEGPGTTNNLAEYTAVIRALAWCWKTQDLERDIVIASDSQLVIRQLTGAYAVRSPAILPLYQQAARGLAGLPHARCEWVRREQNERADSLSRRAFAVHIQHHRECIGRGFTRR